ncbi:nucleotidyltransferase domain-containing protein [Nocardioides mesophilus]|uniref:Nucleotidyltransferase domain-containing protein n=1 Tax=Nocardioides mesophilus TaxID=433659 RepID=A0A7G9R6D4_9ACTN|nr:nucleotidyltransferase domain-containing protein [Nocardioides mesophilus]
MTAVTQWASAQADVSGLALVGSYACNRPRMGSDVDLVLLTNNPAKHSRGLDWVVSFDPRAELIRDQMWGPLRERRVRLRSGLQVELGVVPPSWAAIPLDSGTKKVLRDGCRILHDPDGIFRAALARL